MMKYAFFGSPEFASIILENLIETGFPPALLVCNPDRPVGRKKVITPPLTKIIAQKHNIEFIQPEKLTPSGYWLVASGCTFAIVAAYSKIIPKAILDSFPQGVIGVHPSLLPKYRGASPIQSVLISGETETGVTLYMMDDKIDHGSILVKNKSEIVNGEIYETLHNKLATLSAKLLIETLPKFINGDIKAIPQNESEATFTKKFITQDGFVNETDLAIAQQEGGEKALEIDRKIRALNPEPSTWTIQNSKRIKLLEAELIDKKLVLKKIQHEGKIPQTV